MSDVKILCNGLNDSASEIHEIAKSKGFWDKERNIGELLMLCVSEIGEAMESHRKNMRSNRFDANGLSINFDKNLFEREIKDTFEDEIANTIIRLLDLCAGLNIDIEKHIQLKLEYNKTRPRLHGKEY